MKAYLVNAPSIAAETEALIAEILYASVSLPGQVFRGPRQTYLFFGYSNLQSWASIKDLAVYAPLRIVFLDPDYRRAHDQDSTAVYGIIHIDPDASENDIRSAITASHDVTAPYQFLFACSKCTIFPLSLEWVIFADQFQEIAVVAFRDELVRQAFIEATQGWKVFSFVDGAIKLTGRDPNDEFSARPWRWNYGTSMPTRLEDMSRFDLLDKLVTLDNTVSNLDRALSRFKRDVRSVMRLRAPFLVPALHKYAASRVAPAEMKLWADRLQSRADVEFGSDDVESLRSVFALFTSGHEVSRETAANLANDIENAELRKRQMLGSRF